MKIYLLQQTENSGYDTYDSIVVIANDELDAKSIHPLGGHIKDYDSYLGWAENIDDITATEIGIASEDKKRGVVLTSFNAG